jgi:hypothetical protein
VTRIPWFQSLARFRLKEFFDRGLTMKSSKSLFALVASIAVLSAAAAGAASIDMTDPRRALGREGDVRVDAQLVRETVAHGSPIGVTYQIQNLSDSTIAIAAKVSDASYDEDTRTITVAIGSEVPPDGNMPQMIVIKPGETKVLQASATPALKAASIHSKFSASPRFVQVKVAILRDLSPFAELIAKQDGRTKQRLSDELFEKWFECNDTIFLNSVPVFYTPPQSTDVENRGARPSRGL